MGFFGGLLRAAGGVVRGVLGIPAAAPAVVAPVAAAPIGLAARAARGAGALARRAAPVAAAGAVFGAADLATQAVLGGGTATAAGGGNGRTRTATLVRTVDAVTGEVISERILQGSPFLMRRDLAIAKRVERVLSKQASKLAARRRGKSKRMQLLDAVEDQAIRTALGLSPGPHHHPCPS